MSATVEQALALWGWSGATYALAAARENAVYRVDHEGRSFALRLHRKGYRSDAQLRSELLWMDACARGGVSVPVPVAALSGEMVQTVAGVQVDVLAWLNGAPLSDTFDKLTPKARSTVMRSLGQHMARLHLVSDQWQPPASFTRPAWDSDGLLGETPLWDRFWQNPALSRAQRHQLETFRCFAQQRLASVADTGLIHADLVAGNVMLHGDTLSLIDFDDGGYGFRLFEVATALLKHMAVTDFPALKDALIDGYRQLRPLDTGQLPLFLALRACTYVGWNITRMGEDPTRNARFIATALATTRAAMDHKPRG